MSGARLTGVLILVVLLLGAFWSCTLDKDPDSSTDTPNTPNEGSLDDDEYQTTSQALSMSQGYTNEMLVELFSGIGRIDSISGSPSLSPGLGSVYASTQADSVTITYDGATGYWHIYVEVDDPEEGVSFTFIDSLQFRSGTLVVQWPDESITEIRAGLALTAEAIDGSPNAPSQMLIEYTEDIVVTGEIWSEGVVVANGDGSFLADAETTEDSTTCDFSFNMAAELWDVQIDLAVLDPDACPIGGTISSSGTMDWYCTGGGMTLDVSGSWEAMATYSGDDVVMVVESDGTSWTYNGPCSEL